jgi:hypothetical protein
VYLDKIGRKRGEPVVFRLQHLDETVLIRRRLPVNERRRNKGYCQNPPWPEDSI